MSGRAESVAALTILVMMLSDFGERALFQIEILEEALHSRLLSGEGDCIEGLSNGFASPAIFPLSAGQQPVVEQGVP
jgi:hypothetical protein